MKVTLAGIELANPVIAASGTFGYGIEFEEIVALERLGGFVTKGISLEPMAGHPAPRLLQTAVDLARSGGVVQLLSFLAEPATINAARWLAKQVTVVASNAYTHDDFRRSMTFLADGRVRAQPLHSRTVRLDELEATLRGLSAGPSDDIKVLVDPRRSYAKEPV